MIFKDEFERARVATLARQIAERVALSPEVHAAFAATPREIFAPLSSIAYDLDPAPIAGGQWISSPLTVAKMTMALKPVGARNCLEIGLGSGYQAALLSALVPQVVSIERIRKLYEQARANLKAAGAKVIARCGDGASGLGIYAPYERILFSAAAEQISEAIFAQLAPGGILVAPMQRGGKQLIVRYSKLPDGSLASEELGSCEFVPVIAGVED